MSTEVDSKVVEMRFDNKRFESNVQTSLSTIEKLKQSLKFEGATKGFKDIDKAAKDVDMSPLSRGVENIGLKFNAMYTIADQALRNIVNSAMHAGESIIKALTIDPIKTGFQEYETQINAVQTILANTQSKGATLDDVNGALDELNAYADKTIYNFTEMTRNIGTFTAAGVDLDKSVNAIQGIANLAAVSGSTSQQASTAMYQLSQALASGTVKLMDWNSVVNAGMGGQVFQDALKETARVHGVAIDDMIKNEGSFRETLKNEWLTAEILTETLQKFTLTTEGLTEAQIAENREMLKSKGYTDEQIDAIFELGKTATDAATKVKTFTQLWDTLKEAAQSGWTQTWEIIMGDFEEAKSLFSGIYNTISPMIEASAKARNEMLQGWKDLGGRTALVESLKNAFEGIMSIIKPITEAFREVFPPMTAKQLMEFTEGLKNLTEKLKIGEKTALAIKNTFKGVFSVIELGITIITGLVKGVGKLLSVILPVGDGLLSVSGSLGEFVSGVSDTIAELNIFENIFGGLATIIKPVADAIGGALTGIADGVDGFGGILGIIKAVANGIGWLFDKITEVTEAATGGEGFKPLVDLVNGGLLAGVLVGIRKFMGSLTNIIENGPGIIGGIKDLFEGVGDALNAFTASIKANTLKTIAISIGILAASLFVLASIDSDKMTVALAGISTLFVELFASLGAFEKIMGSSGFKSISKVTMAMVKLSASVLILSFAMKNIAELSWEQIAKGVSGIGILMLELVGISKLMGDGKMVKASAGLITFAGGMLILSYAVEKLGSIDTGELIKGLLAVGALMAGITAMSNLGGTKGLGITKGAGLMLFATGMVILAEAVKMLGSMSIETLGKGLLSMAGALLIVAGAVALIPNSIVVTAAGLVGVATALVILSGALMVMGGMTWEGIAKGLVALAGSLTIIAVALHFMTTALPGAAALLVVSAALAVLAPVLLALGAMSWENIGKGLLALAGAFAVIGVAGLLITPITPGLLAFGAAVALLGAGCALTGVGILALAAGLTALAVAFTASGATIIGAIKALLGLIPTLAYAIGEGIVAMAVAIGNGSEAIVTALVQILNALLQAIIDVIPKATETVIKLLTALCDVIVEMVPKFVDTMLVVLEALLNAIVTFIPKLVDGGMKLLLGILKGIADNIQQVVAAGLEIISELLHGIADGIPGIIDAAAEVIVSFLQGIATAIENHSQEFIDAGWDIAEAIVKGVVKGIAEGPKRLAEGIANLGNAAISKFKEVLGINSPSKEFAEQGGYIVQGLIKGLKDNTSDAVSGAENLGLNILKGMQDALGIHSPSIVFNKDVGRYIVQGIAEGIKKDMSAEEAAEKKAQNIVNAFKKALDKYDTASSNAQKQLDLWKLTDGNKASKSEINAKELEYLNGNLSSAMSKQTLAYDEWKETAKHLGEDSLAAQQAWGKYLDAQIAVSNIQKQISDVNANQLMLDSNEAQKAMDVRDKLREEWLVTDGKYATDAEIDARYLDDYNKDLNNLNTQLAAAEAAHTKAVENYAADSEEVLSAWNSVRDLKIAIANKKDEIAAIEENSINRGYSALETLMDKRSKEHDLWLKTDGLTANEVEKDAKEMTKLNADLNDLNVELVIAEKNYAKAIKEYGEESEEALAAWNTVYDTQSRIADTKNSISQLEKDAVTRQLEAYDLVSSNADLQYQIWEKTTGRKATSVQKNVAKLGVLTQQLSVQSSVLEIARKEWMKAESDYGSQSNEAQSAYNKYLQEQLELANLQNEITDINESTVERQKVAASDYKKYIDKYEKYYAENGMSRDQLINDAKLVSGYDENSTVNNIITNTTNALETMQESREFSTLLDSFTSLGTSYVNAVNEGVSSETSIVATSIMTMVNGCITAMRETRESWVLAGSYLVDGFIQGIRDNIWRAVEAAVEMANSAMEAANTAFQIESPSKKFATMGMYAVMGLAQGLMDNSKLSEDAATSLGKGTISALSDSIKRISEAVDDGIDTQPTIRPVLDLSDVTSGTAKLNNMFSRTQAMRISTAMNGDSGDGIQNGNNPNKGGNTYQFTQNNYSPKALSRTEIYRQTKNQFTAMKGALT